MAINVHRINEGDGEARWAYTCDLPHAALDGHKFTSAPMLSAEIAQICGDTHENTIHGPRVIEVGAHLAWLAGEARKLADAGSEAELLRVACQIEGTTISPDETDYFTIINGAAGQMQAILEALADAILGRRP